MSHCKCNVCVKRAAIALAPEAHGRAGWPKSRQRIRCEVRNRVGLAVWFTFMTAHKLSRTMFWQNVVMRRSITWTIWTCIWTNEWARIHFPSLSCQNYPKIGSQVALKSPIHLVQKPKPLHPPPVVLVEIFHTLQASRDALRLHGAATWTSNRSEAFRLIQEWWEWWKVYEGLPLRSWIFKGQLCCFSATSREGPFFPKKNPTWKIETTAVANSSQTRLDCWPGFRCRFPIQQAQLPSHKTTHANMDIHTVGIYVGAWMFRLPLPRWFFGFSSWLLLKDIGRLTWNIWDFFTWKFNGCQDFSHFAEVACGCKARRPLIPASVGQLFLVAGGTCHNTPNWRG